MIHPSFPPLPREEGIFCQKPICNVKNMKTHVKKASVAIDITASKSVC